MLAHLAVHKQPEVQAAIEAAGAHLRFLPPYSPDFNPIELAFAKLKAFLRAARPRSFDQVNELVAAALVGLFVLLDSRAADTRVALAGMRAQALFTARIGVLAFVTLAAVAVSMLTTALVF